MDATETTPITEPETQALEPRVKLRYSTKELLFGKFGNDQLSSSDMSLKTFNYCLLFAKYYLYCQKLNNKQINFDEFKQRIAFKLRIEGLSSFNLFNIHYLLSLYLTCLLQLAFVCTFLYMCPVLCNSLHVV